MAMMRDDLVIEDRTAGMQSLASKKISPLRNPKPKEAPSFVTFDQCINRYKYNDSAKATLIDISESSRV